MVASSIFHPADVLLVELRAEAFVEFLDDLRQRCAQLALPAAASGPATSSIEQRGRSRLVAMDQSGKASAISMD